jgi:serine/threonine protein kinase
MSLLSPELESTYEVLAELGAGGMGAVYKVRHRVFNDLCVIKVMLANLQANAQARARFEDEARKGRRLDHPNIARVLNFMVGANGNAHLVMEFIDGTNLRAFTERRGGILDPQTATGIGIEVLAALSYLHEHDMVHRDISPDNVMIIQTSGGAKQVKLIDLGIAKSLDDPQASRNGHFAGKPSYAPPEQFGGVVDARSDLYAFGIVLYELLTGQLPIEANSLNAWAQAHYNTPPKHFSQTDPDGRIPETLRQTILKALQKQPGQRFQSAAEFAAALRGSAVPDTVPSTPMMVTPVPAATQPVEKKPTPVKSQRKLWLSLAATAVLLIAGLLWANRTPPEPLSPERKSELANIIRKVVDQGQQPSTADPAIATFMEKYKIRSDDVQPFAVEYASMLRDAAKEIDRGKTAVRKGDIREAYYAFAEAKRIDPENAFAWINYGAAAMMLNKQAEATSAYQRALIIDPQNWLAHYNIGCQYARAGRFNDAIDQISIAVASMRRQSARSEADAILKSMREDDALKELRNDTRFQTLVATR